MRTLHPGCTHAGAGWRQCLHGNNAGDFTFLPTVRSKRYSQPLPAHHTLPCSAWQMPSMVATYRPAAAAANPRANSHAHVAWGTATICAANREWWGQEAGKVLSTAAAMHRMPV